MIYALVIDQKTADLPAVFFPQQSHRHLPVHIEGGGLAIHGQQLPLQLDLDGLVTHKVHRARRGTDWNAVYLLTRPLTTKQPVISDSGEWAQAIDTQIHLSKGTT